VDKAHGRLEKRTLRTTSIRTLHDRWKGLRQGFEVRRERTLNGRTTVEVVYGITSLSEEEADAARLLSLLRDHWRIENCLHYVRVVSLGEDACRVRRGSAPQVLAALRNTVVHLLTTVEADSRIAALERLAAKSDEALVLIGLTPLI
jgi:predicted transposase YbfD/YdcC